MNTAKPRAIGELEGQNFLPLAPTFTTVGGLSLQNKSGFSGSLRYRYIGDRPANADNTIIAKGYFVNDLQANYSQKCYNLGLSIQNIFNVRWKETQFATNSRLKNETEPVEEIHFTPGTPFFARLSLTLFFKIYLEMKSEPKKATNFVAFFLLKSSSISSAVFLPWFDPHRVFGGRGRLFGWRSFF